MRKILIGIAAGGVALVIALGARNQFANRAQVHGAGEPVREAPAVETSGGAALAEPSGAIGGTAGGPERDGQVLEGADFQSEPTSAAAGEVPRGADDAPAVGAPAAEPRASGGAGSNERGEAVAPSTAAPESPAASGDAEDASEILRRASAAYERVTSLSAAFTQRMDNRVLGTQVVSRGMLYQRHPDRFLMRFEEPAGDIIVSDGEYFWVYYPSVDEKQVIRAPARQGNAGAVDLRSQFVGDPVRRFEAKLEGKDTAAGREAHVLTLVPREPAGYRQLRVWVDAGDHLVRRFEITENNGNTRAFELRELTVNPRLGDDLFRFTPPPDARIVDRS